MKRLALAATAVAALALAAPVAAGPPPADWYPGSSSVREMEAFPAGFLGKWAPTAAGCADPDGVDAVHFYPDGVDTYESGGRLMRITQSGEERTVLTRIEFEGEGAFWDATWAIHLGDDGRALSIMEKDETAASVYVKCTVGPD